MQPGDKLPTAGRPVAKPFSRMRRISSFLTAIVGTLLYVAHAGAVQVDDANLPAESKPILRSVIADARASAEADYITDDHDLNPKLKSMDYQAYRAIRFDAQRSLWHDENDYEIQFFHPGFLYTLPVTVVTVGSDNAETVLPFDSGMFRYDTNAEHLAGLTDEHSGFAGFRIHYPIKNQQYKDEFAVFLGASYFRLVGMNHVYGLSARGLAIDTGLPEGEEFPHFTKFWLIEPEEGGPITVYARLESPSVAGAYKFVIQPGSDTQMQVKSWLFAREDVRKLGVAPFTSMFLYGENSALRPDDYRPEVHDSDGVLMVTRSGEQVWRPLTNPQRLQITSLSDDSPQGFGMLQRDVDFASYLDAEANYHLRPGLWVSPKAGFEQGRLEVVEIPTNSETNDNIVAYWVPSEPFSAGQSRYFEYTLTTVERNPLPVALATVVRTTQGSTQLPGEKAKGEAGARRFVVDYIKPQGMDISADALNLTLNASNAIVQQARLYPVDGDRQLRATFVVVPKGKETVDMRLYINHQEHQISEVWNYVYQPK
ncbi:glucan biosynthesis protein G [Alteromonas aestuariivivens]|uniref:Glucan biosynthesis protein G n=2 Tax=Alteromonas aestuariivivens TaxID=1938339 RepID=A0A3D8M5F9_9ALTE|nr:glucan biosynthesis protein G [Alteromonas aestuariivivens]